MKKYIIYLLVLLSNACNHRQEKFSDNYIKINMNDGKYGEIRADSVNYICLEKSKEALFSNIDKARIKDSSIYILDAIGRKKVLCFDISGKYLRSYGNIGKASGEYLRITDFDIDNENQVHILSRHSKKIIIYNKEGVCISEKKMDFRANSLTILNEGHYFFNVDNNNKTQKSKSLVCDQNMNIVKYYDEYTKEDKCNFNSYLMVEESAVGFSNYIPISYLFDCYDNNGKRLKSFYLNFGRHSIPQERIGDADKIFPIEADLAYLTRTPVYFPPFVLGEYSKGDKRYYFKYNERTKELIIDEVNFEEVSVKQIFPFSAAYTRDCFISFMDIEIFEISTEKTDIPSNITKHIYEGGFVIVLKNLSL